MNERKGRRVGILWNKIQRTREMMATKHNRMAEIKAGKIVHEVKSFLLLSQAEI